MKNNELKPLPPTSLYCIDVPEDAENIEEHGNYITYHTGMGTEDYDILRYSFDEDYEVVGEVTKEEILFDCEPHIDSWNSVSNDGTKVYENYAKGIPKCRSADKSFRSLLTSNGILFENPIERPELKDYSIGQDCYNWEKMAEDTSKFESFEDKLITGKLLILTKK